MAFCDETEGAFLRDIEKLIKRKLEVVPTPPLIKMAPAPAPAAQDTRNDDERTRKPNRPFRPWDKNKKSKPGYGGRREGGGGGGSFKPKAANAGHRGGRGR
jgi:hypothetical protein